MLGPEASVTPSRERLTGACHGQAQNWSRWRRSVDQSILQPRIVLQANRIYNQQQHIQPGAHSPAHPGPHATGPQHARVRLPALPLRLQARP